MKVSDVMLDTLLSSFMLLNDRVSHDSGPSADSGVSWAYRQQGMSSGKQFKLGLNTQPNTQLVNALTELNLQPLNTDVPHAFFWGSETCSSAMFSCFSDKASS